jgi:hypothetical protein
VELLWQQCVARLYSLPPRQRQLGLGVANGISTYFSANCDESDAARCGKFLEHLGLSPYNTRLFKQSPGRYTVLLASAETRGADAPEAAAAPRAAAQALGGGDGAVGSAEGSAEGSAAGYAVGALCRAHDFDGATFEGAARRLRAHHGA